MAASESLLDHLINLAITLSTEARTARSIGDRVATRRLYEAARLQAQPVFEWLLPRRDSRAKLLILGELLIEAYQATDRYEAAAEVAARLLTVPSLTGERREVVARAMRMGNLRPIVGQLRATR